MSECCDNASFHQFITAPTNEVVTHVTTNVPKRKWNNKYFGFFCDTTFSTIPRHLYSAHSDEDEIAHILATRDKNKKEILLTKLLNRGNHKHNCLVWQDGIGSMQVVYRQQTPLSSQSSIPCQYCFGYYVRGELWRHTKRCKARPFSYTPLVGAIAGGELLLPCNTSTSVKLLFTEMKSGSIKALVKNDLLLLRFAEKSIKRVANSKHHNNYIRAKLREIARVVLQVRKCTPTLKMQDSQIFYHLNTSKLL